MAGVYPLALECLVVEGDVRGERPHTATPTDM